MTPESEASEPSDSALDRRSTEGRWRHARWGVWVYWGLLAVGMHWPRLPLPQREPLPLEAVLQLDKVAHAVGFAGLTLLLILSGLGSRGRSWAGRCGVGAGIGLLYGVLSEWSQSLLPSRTASGSDMLTNAMAVLGVYLVCRLPGRVESPRRRWGLVFWMAVSVPGLYVLLSSHAVMRWLVAQLQSRVDTAYGPLHPYDYIAHGVGALVFSVALISAWPMASRRPRVWGAAALLLLALSGPGIEVMQHYTGRGVEAMDVLSHSIGVFVAMAYWAVRLNTSPMPRTADDEAASTAPAAAAAPGGKPGFVGHAVLVSLLTLVSRFAGLARDAVLAAALGLSAVADAFFIGFLVPNLFRRLFGEGALTAAFIPHYTALLERDPQLARRFATLTLTLLTVVLVGITLAAELGLWWLASTMDPAHKASLAVYYTRLMLPYMPLICAVALVGGMLQVHKRFGPPAAVPLVLNGVIVAAVLVSTGFFSGDTDPHRVATWVAVGVLVAGVLQLCWQVSVLLEVTGLSRSFRGCWPTMRSMLLMMGPMVLGLAVFQINALLDALIAFFFAPGSSNGAEQQLSMFGQIFDAPLRNGDVAALNWSQRLYQFPLGVFGIAIATAIFPALSAAAAKFVVDSDELKQPAEPQAATPEFAAIVRQGLRLTVFIALPASAGLILVRVPLARTVFEHGGFKTDDALRVAAILAGYASSVWAYSMTHTLTRAYYAMQDAKTPLKISAAMVGLNLALNLSLIWPLGAAGLAWSTAISAAGQVALLLLLLRKRVDQPIDNSVITSWTRTMIATTVMAAVLFAASVASARVADGMQLNWSESAMTLVAMVLLGAAVFFLATRLMRSEELDWLRKRSVK
ncbi:MAG: murein biosynthesis integral membrane protein MurJ [Phycisphaeraceae bacterium]